ncbi:unnamed protein product, partial [marine sediment metagenome]
LKFGDRFKPRLMVKSDGPSQKFKSIINIFPSIMSFIYQAKFKNYKEIAEYINRYTTSELFITDLEKKKNTISRDIYLGRIDNIEDLKRVLEIIDNLNLKINRKEEDRYKFIPQQIISFYSIQGGVGKTSMVFNFAW